MKNRDRGEAMHVTMSDRNAGIGERRQESKIDRHVENVRGQRRPKELETKVGHTNDE